MSSNFNIKLNRSRSADSLSVSSNHYVKRDKSYDRFYDYFNHDNHLQSDLSQEIFVVIDDHSDTSSIDKENQDSGVTNTSKFDETSLSSLDRKINKLNHMLEEQHLLLKKLKEDLIASNVVSTLSPTKRLDLPKDSFNTLEDGTKILNNNSLSFGDGKTFPNDLNVIKNMEIQNIDTEIRQALTEFLQSDDLKDHIASATADSVKSVVSACFSTVFPGVYLPIMEQCHRRLLRHVTRTLENAFNGLEAGSASLFKSMHRIIRIELEKHQVLLEESKSGDNFDNFQNMLQVVLKNELKDWREKLQDVLTPQLQGHIFDFDEDATEPISPNSPPQPAHPERSIIDQLMKTAEINKHIKDGDINKSFEEALSSADLSLVMAACKAADLNKVFSTPCSLNQSVLLSLVQQLATDMVHDTQLKCRYLEEAIINLNTNDPITRMHLPLVVGEVRKHLSRFLRSFPSHIANRRIKLIIMAANNLLK